MKELWTEKYRPKNISEYVFKDQKQRTLIEKWIKDKTLPHVLLSGSAGVGKTSLAKMLFNELGVDPYDIREINASKDNGVEFIRDSVIKFAETMPVGDMKYILLDESDFLSVNAQSVLRNAFEKYSSTVRFVSTCNYPNKIIPAIHSRCQSIHIEKLDRDEFTVRAANILLNEGIEFDIDVLDKIVDMAYPDLRKTINLMQMNCNDNVLCLPETSSAQTKDYQLEMSALFKAGKYKEGRQLICSQASYEEYDDIFRYLYQNLDMWADSDDKEDKCILIIRDGLVKDISCADRELNLSATLTELSMVARGIL
jgi:DNA polymerase III delta prime subunit